MELSQKKVYEILKNKGVDTIYHANSVITACQFLRFGALLSRGTVTRKGLYQTKQKSDESDKKYGIWFDVFTDSVDIHDRAKRANLYGPVLFVLNSELIKSTYTGKVWVTKLNPTKWRGKTHKQRWFISCDDLSDNFKRGRFDQMIVFRHCGGELPFKKYLKEIIIDDPKQNSSIDFFSMACGAIKLAITEGQLNVKISKRKCQKNCTCIDEYQSDFERLKHMYVP